jgi:hypothetical protein
LGPSEIGFTFHPVRFRYGTGGINLFDLFNLFGLSGSFGLFGFSGFFSYGLFKFRIVFSEVVSGGTISNLLDDNLYGQASPFYHRLAKYYFRLITMRLRSAFSAIALSTKDFVEVTIFVK